MDSTKSATGAGLYLRVTDNRQMLLGGDPRPLVPRQGQVDYREIIIGGEACTPPPGGDTQSRPPAGGGSAGGGTAPGTTPTQFLGNSRDREVHDLKNAKKTCQIDKIAADRRVYFKTAADAVKAGYDYCAYCFGKAKSKR
jgi:hypothetical protein